MFFGLDPAMQSLHGVSLLDLNRDLRKDRTMVDLFVNEVDSDSGDGDSVLEGLLDGVRSGKCRKQGGVDVDDPVGKPVDERRTENPHEPRQDHRFRPAPLDDGGERSRERVTIGVVGPQDRFGGHTRIGRTAQRTSIRSIGDHEGNVGADRRIIEEDLEIGARTRREYCDVDLRASETLVRAAV